MIKYAITMGEITDAGPGGKSANTYVNYIYTVNGKTYKGSSGTNLNYGTYRVALNDARFPVLYSSIDTETSVILISPNDFEKYNIPIPDSLSYVKNFIP